MFTYMNHSSLELREAKPLGQVICLCDTILQFQAFI